ncbi:hypothetical protein ACOMHN_062958 [Nucella lapillus]
MSSPVSGQPFPPLPDPSVPCPLQSAVSHFHHFLTFCSMSSPVSGQPFPPLPDPSVPRPLQSAVSHFHHFLTFCSMSSPVSGQPFPPLPDLLFHVLSSQRSAISTTS